jgi:TonB family protein
MTKRHTLWTVLGLALLRISVLAGSMGASHAQALALADSAGPSPDQPVIRQQTMQPATGNSPIVRSGLGQTISTEEGIVQVGRLLRMTPPFYPPTAKQTGVTGVVTVEARIDKDGHVVETSVLRGPYPLRRSAQDAVKRWRYEPTLLNGRPVGRVTRVSFRFVLGRYSDFLNP